MAAVLGIRLYLELTGYPQVGGGSLHVAHVLWGGLLMMVALVILLAFLNSAALRVAAVIGGLGFGTFIDELGKFLTHDNNYFFQPTAALIYVMFVLMYLGFRGINSRSELTHEEKLANAMHITSDGVFTDLDPQRKRHAMQLLEDADDADPVVQSLRTLIESMEASQISKQATLYSRIKSGLNQLYRKLLAGLWFRRGLLSLFILFSITTLVESVVLIFSPELILDAVADGEIPTLSYIEIGALVFPIISGMLVIIGVLRFRRSRVGAYRMFQSALLISVFLTQVFAFYSNQFIAVFGLAINVLMLLAVQYMIDQEKGVGAPNPAEV